LKKRSHKTKAVRFFVPVGCATEQSTFGATLGLYGLRITDFCKVFNRDSAGFYSPGVMVSAVLYIFGKTSMMGFDSPTSYHFSNCIFDFNNNWTLRKFQRQLSPSFDFSFHLLALAKIGSDPRFISHLTSEKTLEIRGQYRTFNSERISRLWRELWRVKKQHGSRNRRKIKGRVKR